MFFRKKGLFGKPQRVPLSSTCGISVAGNQLGYSSCLDLSPIGVEARDSGSFVSLFISCRWKEF